MDTHGRGFVFYCGGDDGASSSPVNGNAWIMRSRERKYSGVLGGRGAKNFFGGGTRYPVSVGRPFGLAPAACCAPFYCTIFRAAFYHFWVLTGKVW